MSDDLSAYTKGFRDGELSALDEFTDRFKAKLEEIQAAHRPEYERAVEIVIAAGTTVKDMRNERE